MIADQSSRTDRRRCVLDQVEELLTALPSTLGGRRELVAGVRTSFDLWGPAPTAAGDRRLKDFFDFDGSLPIRQSRSQLQRRVDHPDAGYYGRTVSGGSPITPHCVDFDDCS
jgi:hypothetical protein